MSIENELARRAARGFYPRSLAEIESALRGISYRLDRDMDCRSVSRYVSGPHTGETYPVCNMYVRQVDDGLSAFNVDARRDAAFMKLQEWRMNGELFAVVRGTLYEF